MINVVVILKDKDLNATLASVEYNQWGQKTNQPIIICDSWHQGFAQAKLDGHVNALFVRSGTVFLDWEKWTTLLDYYPNQGLIAHIIWHPGQQLYLDDQCWFVDLNKFVADDLLSHVITHPVPIRSEINIHSDYTPLWVRPGNNEQSYFANNFGQGLISRQLNNRHIISNWNNLFRDLKFFCYSNVDVDLEINKKFKDYLELAENQLWVFNNEELTLTTNAKLITPGSGIFWMLNIIQPDVQEIEIVDISQVQINFCNELWSNWDGTEYGEFVWNFIKRYNLKHFEIDQANLSKIDRIKLRNPVNFKLYVNQKFDQLLTKHQISNFKTRWLEAQQCKTLKITCGNLVHWLLDHPDMISNTWTSNILDYKWTKLKTSHSDCKKIQSIL